MNQSTSNSPPDSPVRTVRQSSGSCSAHYTASIEPRRHSTTNYRPSSSANCTAALHTIPVSSFAFHRTAIAYTSVSTWTISPSQLVHQCLITDLCDALKERYSITESDNLESFLGIHIVQDQQRIYLSQPGHIAKCAKTAGITPTTKPAFIPMSPHFNDEEQNDSPPADKSAYSTLLGMLIFVLRTRPDVAYAVNRLATRASTPTQRDLEALRQVANYLYTTAHLELVYNNSLPEHRNSVAQLIEFSDAAFIAHSDSKSHTGLMFKVRDATGVFHARSQKQKDSYAQLDGSRDICRHRIRERHHLLPKCPQRIGLRTARSHTPLR